MAAQRPTAIVARRGEGTWKIGAAIDGLDLSKFGDAAGTSRITLTTQVDSAHTQDSNGNVALTAYFNENASGSVNLVYVPGKKPKPGNILVFTDPDDENKQKALQIVRCGDEIGNDNTARMITVEWEWYAGWQDDAEVIAAG